MIYDFNSFNESNSMTKLNESILYFSPKLRDKLFDLKNQYNSSIAKDLLSSEGQDSGTDITFVDLDKDDYLTFTTMTKAKASLDKNWPDKVDLDKTTNTELSDILHGFDSLSNGPGIFKNGRSQIKIGKFVNKILGNYTDSKVEEFVNMFKSTEKSPDEEIKIVSGKEILKWYTSDNYFNTSGTLGNSCMTDKFEVLGMYVKNPDVCKLLIITSHGKLIARALVWKIDTIDFGDKDPGTKPTYFMDRGYYNSDHLINKLRRYATEEGWCYRTTIANKNSVHTVYKGIVYNDIKMTVKLKPENYKYYPYLDTLRRYEPSKGILHNDDGTTDGIRDRSLEGIILTSMFGGYTGEVKPKIIDRFKNFFK